MDVTWDLPVFVGGMVAAICWFAAGLTWYATGGVSAALNGLSLALVWLGIVALGAGGLLGAALLWRARAG